MPAPLDMIDWTAVFSLTLTLCVGLIAEAASARVGEMLLFRDVPEPQSDHLLHDAV